MGVPFGAAASAWHFNASRATIKVGNRTKTYVEKAKSVIETKMRKKCSLATMICEENRNTEYENIRAFRLRTS